MIVCRSQSEIAKLRRVNQLVARILAELRQAVAAGVTTRDLDQLAERLRKMREARAGSEAVRGAVEERRSEAAARAAVRSVGERMAHRIEAPSPTRSTATARRSVKSADDSLVRAGAAAVPGSVGASPWLGRPPGLTNVTSGSALRAVGVPQRAQKRSSAPSGL